MRPEDRKYAPTHEWAKIDGDTVLVGITDFAVQQLSHGQVSDLVYCDLPSVGRQVEMGETFGEIESVKAVADLNSPVSGEVVEINPVIEEHLEVLADDPWSEGWMIRLKPTSTDLGHLLDAAGYEKVVAETQEA